MDARTVADMVRHFLDDCDDYLVRRFGHATRAGVRMTTDHDHNEPWDNSDIRVLKQCRRAGMTSEEIGDKLGRSGVAVKSKIARLRAKGVEVPAYRR